MATYVALLRGINVGGHAQVSMQSLREMLSRLGFSDPQSLLNSGNLIFRTAVRTTAGLERMLEAEAKKRLSLETQFFVRTASEWKSIISHNPVPNIARKDPGRFVVMTLKGTPGQASVTALRQAIVGRETVYVRGNCAYLTYPDGQGRSRLSNALIESKLGTRGTARNWNTVLKLDEVCSSGIDS